MSKDLLYVPIFRSRTEEDKVLKNFVFGKHIYPYVEILKEVDRRPITVRKNKPVAAKKVKTFEQTYLYLLSRIKCERVFVDLPVHFEGNKRVKPEVLEFFRRVILNRSERTKYLIRLSRLAYRIIPVISTYSQTNNQEPNSIVLQENDLRNHFEVLAFRTIPKTFDNDIKQIRSVARSTDYLIVDLNGYDADPEDDDLIDLANKLQKCSEFHIVMVKSAIHKDVKTADLQHGKEVEGINNNLVSVFSQLHGNSFGDYVGIKKDGVERHGGGREKPIPGFIFYDPLDNIYLGFKGMANDWADFENVIVPDLLKHEVIKRMKDCDLSYLGPQNRGWKLINDIGTGDEAGKSAGKFKRISMEHYLHCIRTKIEAGEIGR